MWWCRELRPLRRRRRPYTEVSLPGGAWMSSQPVEPDKEPAWDIRFYSPEEALEAVKRDPRPWRGGGEYVIEDLTDEESRLFWEALAET